MVRLLNCHSQVIVGNERFARVLGSVTAQSFAPERFFAPSPAEAKYRDESFYGPLAARWESGGVRYLGDKHPRYLRRLAMLRERFAHPKIVVLLRELEPVASSYNARAAREGDAWSADYQVAVRDWNEALQRTWEALQEDPENVLPIRYERIFAGEESALQALFAFLGLALERGVRRGHARMTRQWPERQSRPLLLDEAMRQHIAREADGELRDRVWAAADSLQSRWSRQGVLEGAAP